MKTPLWQALSAHVSAHLHSQHTPGHKSGHLVPKALRQAWGDAIWAYDLTEVGDLDNLVDPQGVLAESMHAWANARACASVHYLLGGSSLGLRAAILALCRGQKVFVPRHAHHSIYEGLALAGAAPVTLEVTFDDALGIPLGVAPETLQAAIRENPDCKRMLLVHPTYHGITWQNEALLALARPHGILTIADSAHGAHFTTTLTPPSALALGAEVAVESAHKTLPCLTQASILLSREEALSPLLARAIQMLQTTSPSYLLMASLEAAGAWLDDEGVRVMAAGVRRIQALEDALHPCFALSLTRKREWQQDPFKLYLTSPNASGETIARLLAEKGWLCEMTDGRGALLMSALDGPDEALVKALLDVSSALGTLHEPIPRPCYAPSPERVLSPSEIWLAEGSALPLEEAEGFVALDVLEVYPPGIPLLLPGERVTKEVIDAWAASGHSTKKALRILPVDA